MTDLRLLEVDFGSTPVEGSVPAYSASSGTFVLRPSSALTGEVKTGFWATAPSGWLKLEGGTVGDASSGGTVRANADTSSLFSYLWTNVDNTRLPIQDSAGAPSVRGASAAADFAAHKRMPLPDLKGRMLMGQDSSGTGSNMAETGGAKDHTHTVPAHYHAPGTGSDIAVSPQANRTIAAYAAAATGNRLAPALAGTDFEATTLSVSGRIGLVTGGVDGNAAMTSGANNQAYLAATFIIAL